MTPITIDQPTDEQSFRTGLTELLHAARENDVDVERAWECDGGDDHGWEVEIVQLLADGPTN